MGVGLSTLKGVGVMVGVLVGGEVMVNAGVVVWVGVKVGVFVGVFVMVAVKVGVCGGSGCAAAHPTLLPKISKQSNVSMRWDGLSILVFSWVG